MKWKHVGKFIAVSFPGSIIRLGRHHLFRFNHPGEAARLREELSGVSVLWVNLPSAILIYELIKISPDPDKNCPTRNIYDTLFK